MDNKQLIGIFFVFLQVNLIFIEAGEKVREKKKQSELVTHHKKQKMFVDVFFALGVDYFSGWILCAIFCRGNNRDTTPPKVNCPKVPSKYAEKGEKTAVISWPAVTSSEGNVKQETPKGSGDKFPEGEHYILYTAKDGAGNMGHCYVHFVVKVQRCPYPQSPDNGNVRCTDSGVKYGATCSYSCLKGYTLQGLLERTCDANGKLSGIHPQCEVKKCEPPQTPNNTANKVCTANNDYNSVCHFPCSPGFTRTTGSGFIICQHNETWMPRIASPCEDAKPPYMIFCPTSFTAYVGEDQNNAVIEYSLPKAGDNIDKNVSVFIIEGPTPNTMLSINRDEPSANIHRVMYSAKDSAGLDARTPCTFYITIAEIQQLNRYRLPVELYYEGECTTQKTQQEIREAFFNTTLTSSFRSRCTRHPECNVQNVEVICGDTRKTTAKQILIKFDFTINFNYTVDQDKEELNDELDAQIYGMLNQFEDDLQSGMLDIETLELQAPADIVGPQEPDLDCVEGTIPKYSRFECIACPAGTMFDENGRECTECPVGTYQDKEAQITCTQCPTGQSTAATGSRRFEDCKDVCPLGHISVSGLVPCYPCAESTYQDELGQKACKPCPEGSSSAVHGSTSVLSCISVCNKKGGHVFPFSKPKLLKAWKIAIKRDKWEPSKYSFVCQSHFDENDYEQKTTCGTVPLQKRLKAQAVPHIFQWTKTPSENVQARTRRAAKRRLDMSLESPTMTKGWEIVGANEEVVQEAGTSIEVDRKRRNPMQDAPKQQGDSYTDVCTGDKCGDHGTCVPDPDSAAQYICVCKDGYSGEACSLPPDECSENLCQNGGTCIPLTVGYNCSCNNNYTGVYCETKIVNGGWSPYNDWTQCSVSCGHGLQHRYRQCNNPRSKNGGSDCQGTCQDRKECILEKCSECEDLKKLYGGQVEIDEQNGTLTAVLICKNGRMLSDPNFNTFTCSQNTGYRWNPDISSTQFPGCTESQAPKYIALTADVEYDVDVLPDDVNVFGSPAEELLNESKCSRNRTCEVTTTVNVITSQQKRDSAFRVLVSMKINASFTYESYFTNRTIDNEKAKPVLEEYTDTIHGIEELAQTLQNATSDGTLGVEIDGEFVYPDEDRLAFHGNLGCPNGLTSLNGLCVKCPPGKKEVDGECVECEINTYQELEGQTNCISCPAGEVTDFIGSDSRLLCKKNITTSPATSIEVSLSYSPSPTEIDDSEGTLLYLIAMPVLVVIVGAIGLAVWICVSSKTFIWKVKGKKYVTQSIE